MEVFFNDLKRQFILNFIEKDRWKLMVNGLENTLKITIVAALIGIVIGILLASIRSTYDKQYETLKKHKGVKYYVLSFLNFIAQVYLTVIRGTPVVVQLLIAFFIIFASAKNGVAIAMLAFGINSGAYVAEIFRGGIMAIDNGQFEAGYSLGFNYFQTMIFIVIPQVVKNVLPMLLNEFIALLKETSVAGYVAVTDITRAGNVIRGTTFSPFMPLIAVALFYLIMVMILTQVVKRVERRLRKSER